MSTPDDAGELIRGAVDLYIHSVPDLLPRRVDDLQLAADCKAAGLSAAVHRNHYCPTADRSKLAADATGFALLGAVLLNDSVGGVNPWAVDLALQLGAVWIGFPTLSAKAMRASGMARTSAPGAGALGFGPGELEVLRGGALSQESRDVLKLAVDADVAINMGYLSNTEVLALARAAAEMGHRRMVLTNARLSDAEFDSAMEIPGFFLEVTSYGVHPEGLGGANSAERVGRNVELIRRAGTDRIVLSSDGGMVNAPSPAEILKWGLRTYAEAGFTMDELRTMCQVNPRLLVPAPPA
jgi:Family of unknown function (DUF6282)